MEGRKKLAVDAHLQNCVTSDLDHTQLLKAAAAFRFTPIPLKAHIAYVPMAFPKDIIRSSLLIFILDLVVIV